MSNKETKTDVILIGAGIMSATLGTLTERISTGMGNYSV